jgi:hypothetical protein
LAWGFFKLIIAVTLIAAAILYRKGGICFNLHIGGLLPAPPWVLKLSLGRSDSFPASNGGPRWLSVAGRRLLSS